jgi:hypothetical protein
VSARKWVPKTLELTLSLRVISSRATSPCPSPKTEIPKRFPS